MEWWRGKWTHTHTHTETQCLKQLKRRELEGGMIIRLQNGVLGMMWVLTLRLWLTVFTHHGLEAGVELCEEGRLVSLGQHPLLHHRAFNVIILDHDVFLQDLDGVQLLRRLHLRQHYLQPAGTQWVRGHNKLYRACIPFTTLVPTLPKLPFPSRARKLKSFSRTRSMLPEGRLNRRWSDGVITFLPWPSLAFCGVRAKNIDERLASCRV